MYTLFMADTPPKVDRKNFEDVVKGLLHQQPMKRDEIRKDDKKPAKIIVPKQP
jgi:hypothetical protein